MDRTRLALVAAVLALTATSATAAPTAGALPPSGPADAVCSEPGGQTDSPPQPRLRRAVVGGVDVAVVLPPGYVQSHRRYPVVYLLHGAQGDEDSWIEYGGLMTDSAARAPAEQAIVVMPKMGLVTGLAVDWVDGHRRDATLIGRTLVSWVDRTWRTLAERRHRAIAGYSGGGLSAAHLAQRFPRVFGQLGVFSGPVDLGNPATQPVAYLGFEAERLCAGDLTGAGPLGDPVTHADAWAATDPLRGATRLRKTFVYLSSGNGQPCSPEDAANLAYPTAATELQIRQQMDAFSQALTDADVRHVVRRHDCGLHWWTRWRPDLAEFWDLAAERWR